MYYSPDDILKLPSRMIPTTAKEVWEKDELKRSIANYYKYDVIYIWENEINNCKNHTQLYSLFIDRMSLRNVYDQPS